MRDEAPTNRSTSRILWAFAVLSSLGLAAAVHRLERAPWVPPASTSHILVTPSPDVVTAVRSLSRLETVEFHVERVVELTDEQTHVFGLVSSRDALVLVAAGDVTAGVDLSTLREGDVDVAWGARRVTVTLPRPVVLHAALDSARTHVFRRDTDALARRDEGLEGRARAEAERSMREAARSSGLLDRARENGERSVRTLLTGLGFRDVSVRWRDRDVAVR